MTHLVFAGIANFLWILLKALQQRNVAYNNYGLIWVVSYFLAMSEIIMVVTIASQGVVLPLVLVMGTTGALGCMSAMYLHGLWLRR